MPPQLKVAISVGIGLFIALIGFVDARFVPASPTRSRPRCPSSSASAATSPAGRSWSSASGLVLVIALWVAQGPRRDPHLDPRHHRRRDHRGEVAEVGPAFTAVGVNPEGWSLNVPGRSAATSSGCRPSTLLGNFNLFGVLGRTAGVARRAAPRLLAAAGRLLRHDGHDDRHRCRGRPATTRTAPRPTPSASSSSTRSRRSPAARPGSRRNTSYIESASGVGEGARTGLASVVTGLLFLLATFFTPLVQAIPSEAAVPGARAGRLPDDAAGHRASTGATSRSPSRRSSRSC